MVTIDEKNTSSEKLTEICYEKAVEVIKGHTHEYGMTASGEIYDPAIYTRDVMISSIGSLLVDDEKITEAVRHSIETLSGHQSDTGMIPTAVLIKNSESKNPEHEVHYVDSDGNILHTLCCYWYFIKTNDKDFLKEQIKTIEKSIFWLRCQDVDNCGLLETREASNWMDAFPQQHNVLYDNVLWYMALKALIKMTDVLDMDNTVYQKILSGLKRKINMIFWISQENSRQDEINLEFKDLWRKYWTYKINMENIAGRPYYIPFSSFMGGASYFDSLGNCLAILADIASDDDGNGRKEDLILNYIRDVGVDSPYPLKAIHPVIPEKSELWRQYMGRGLDSRDKSNIPDQYHNGAVWPFIGGVYVTALMKANRKEAASSALEQLAGSNYPGYKRKWGFNEFLHGKTGNPMGSDCQLWNAAMYVLAWHAVNDNENTFLKQLW